MVQCQRRAEKPISRFGLFARFRTAERQWSARRRESNLKRAMIRAFLLTVGTAMVPVVELRGAIPLGWAAGLPLQYAVLAAILGNLLPVPFLLLLCRRVFQWLRHFPKLDHFLDSLERRAHLKGKTVRKYRLLGLILLVAIPLPGTGAWTGALVAVMLDIRMRTALPAIALGVVIAAILVGMLTHGILWLF